MAQKADREKEEMKRREAEERLEQAKIEEAVRRSEEEAKVLHLTPSHASSCCTCRKYLLCSRPRRGARRRRGG